MGILLPFLFIAKDLKNQHIVLEVDNIACVYAWEKRYTKDDVVASILVKCLHLTAHFLGSMIYVKHVPRKSTFMSDLAVRLSRKSSTTKNDQLLVTSFSYNDPPAFIKNWMKKPEKNWNLVDDFLSHVEDLCK